MAESKIPVDLFNPGQVFACLGFMELAEVLLGDAEARFDWSDPKQAWFRLAANGDEYTFKAAISFVMGADLKSVSPSVNELNTAKWKVQTRGIDEDKAFPFPSPNSPATLPIELSKDIYLGVQQRYRQGRRTQQRRKSYATDESQSQDCCRFHCRKRGIRDLKAVLFWPVHSEIV